MLIKIADMTLFIEISLDLPHDSYLLKGVSNLFDFSSYSTYPEFNLPKVFSVHKAYQNLTKTKRNEKMFEIGGIRLNR